MKKLRIWSIAMLAVSLGMMSCDKEDDSDDNENPVAKVGAQGEWQSSGSDVAPLLVTLFNTDSIYVNFGTDMTYTVEQYDSSGAMLTLSGVYTQTKSGTDNIYDVLLEQTSPGVLTSEGIFEITGTTMKYEVVQTLPDIGATPPSATGGFGSTNGGALGTLNVQTYQRIE